MNEAGKRTKHTVFTQTSITAALKKGVILVFCAERKSRRYGEGDKNINLCEKYDKLFEGFSLKILHIHFGKLNRKLLFNISKMQDDYILKKRSCSEV